MRSGSIVFILTAAAVVAGPPPARGQYQVGGGQLYTAYVEGFDSLGTGGVTWANNTNIANFGLYASNNSSPTTVAASTGSSTAGAFYNYGTSGGSDRSLGGLTSGTVPNNALNVAFSATNNVGQALEKIVVGYTGRQWRSGSATADGIAFEYGYGSTYAAVPSWTNVAALNFTAPVNDGSGALNGTLAANSAVIAPTDVTLHWEAGATLWVRFRDIDVAGADHGLGVDNFNFTPAPEPGTVLGLSALAVGLARVTRRRRPA